MNNGWKRVTNLVLVFGSNTAGRHGKGAAQHARQSWGAIYGQGEGLQGSSYALPTKDENLKVLSLEKIKVHLEIFFKHALLNQHITYLLTPIGTGLAGYKVNDIMDIIKDIPEAKLTNNVVYTKEWFNL